MSENVLAHNMCSTIYYAVLSYSVNIHQMLTMCITGKKCHRIDTCGRIRAMTGVSIEDMCFISNCLGIPSKNTGLTSGWVLDKYKLTDEIRE